MSGAILPYVLNANYTSLQSKVRRTDTGCIPSRHTCHVAGTLIRIVKYYAFMLTLQVLLLKVNKEGPLKKEIWRMPGNQAQARQLQKIMQSGRLVNISNFSVYTACSVIKVHAHPNHLHRHYYMPTGATSRRSSYILVRYSTFSRPKRVGTRTKLSATALTSAQAEFYVRSRFSASKVIIVARLRARERTAGKRHICG